jgi:outer membrane protein assembly factor BamB
MWKARVGIGFSSVSISEGKAFTLGNTNNEDTIWCFDAASGKVIWSKTYLAALQPQWYEGGPGATPTIDRGRVFTVSKWGDVFCLDAQTGTVIWTRDLRQDGIKPSRWGCAGSPLVWSDLVILNAGASGVALNRDTGRIAWCNGTNGAGYASATLFRPGDQDQVLIFAAKHLVCVEPRTGRELWRHFWETGWDTNITDPLVWERRILISSFTRGCALLEVSGDTPEMRYDSKVLYNHLSPGIRIGEYLYAFSGEAKKETDFQCVHLPSGQLRWKSKEPAFGSLICAGPSLVVLSEKGELFVGAPSPNGFQPSARAKVLSGTCWVPPSLANGFLYVRNAAGELRCLDLRP